MTAAHGRDLGTGPPMPVHITFADPLPVASARVAARAAARLGYEMVGICRHCSDSVIKVTCDDPWIHRDHGTAACRTDRLRPEQTERWSSHSNQLGDRCPWSGEPAQELVNTCPAGCRSATREDGGFS
jgi:hypothetical protein